MIINKVLAAFASIHMLVGCLLLTGCDSKTINEENPVAEINIDLSSNNIEVGTPENNNIENGIEYTLVKLDLYSKFNLNEEENEYIAINSVHQDKVYFSYENSKDAPWIGRSSRTLKIGTYSIGDDSVSIIKEFQETIYVYDMVSGNDNDLIYTCFDENSHWYVKRLIGSEEIILDSGDGYYHMPKLARTDEGRIFYLYEKTISEAGELKAYQYGVNEIFNGNEVIGIDFNTIDIRDENDIINKEALISGILRHTNDTLAYLVHIDKVPYVSVILLESGIRQNIAIKKKIYNVNLIHDGLMMSLVDDKTGEVSLILQNIDTNEVINGDADFALYRMESDGRNSILAIDFKFNIYAIYAHKEKLEMLEIEIDDHARQSVSFESISENMFLIHFGYAEPGKNQLYLLSIK